jgi:hypothetical protein
MAGLVPAIYVLLAFFGGKNVDGRDKPGHDGNLQYLRDGEERYSTFSSA